MALKSKKILILANEFPYGCHEQYMESEEKYYSRFDRAWIAALGINKTAAESRRDLQSKAEVIPVWYQSRHFYRINCFTALADRNLYQELFELIKTHRFTKQRAMDLLYYLSKAHHEARVIDKALKNEDKQDLLIYSYRFEYQPYVALLLKRKWGNTHKIVCRAHGYDLYEERNMNNYLPMRSTLLREVDYVFPCSKYGAEYIKNKYPTGKAQVDARYLGTSDHGEKVFSSGKEPLLILSCSNVLKVKRIDKIIDALSFLKDIPIEWTHFGDGALMDEIRQYAEDKLGSNVKVSFAGNIANTELMNTYAAKDFYMFLNVSSSEGLPVSVMEAMSFGIPCIATDVGGTGEIVKNDHGTLISKDAAAGEIAEAIRAVYSMKAEDYQTLRHHARRFWESHFNADKNYHDFFEELVALQ